jgi:glycosyltransferase involved in cell wall biosynthesis
MTDVSIVVPTRNRAQRLRALLASMAEQDGPEFEVIVADNASSDDTLAAVAEADSRSRGDRCHGPWQPRGGHAGSLTA